MDVNVEYLKSAFIDKALCAQSSVRAIKVIFEIVYAEMLVADGILGGRMNMKKNLNVLRTERLHIPRRSFSKLFGEYLMDSFYCVLMFGISQV